MYQFCYIYNKELQIYKASTSLVSWNQWRKLWLGNDRRSLQYPYWTFQRYLRSLQGYSRWCEWKCVVPVWDSKTLAQNILDVPAPCNVTTVSSIGKGGLRVGELRKIHGWLNTKLCIVLGGWFQIRVKYTAVQGVLRDVWLEVKEIKVYHNSISACTTHFGGQRICRDVPSGSWIT